MDETAHDSVTETTKTTKKTSSRASTAPSTSEAVEAPGDATESLTALRFTGPQDTVFMELGGEVATDQVVRVGDELAARLRARGDWAVDTESPTV